VITALGPSLTGTSSGNIWVPDRGSPGGTAKSRLSEFTDDESPASLANEQGEGGRSS
jgi:hypothetical protein